MHQAFPEDSLRRTHPGTWFDAISPRAVHRRYYRRVIECRDGLVRISPFLVQHVPDGSQDGSHAVSPETAARHLRAALNAYTLDQPAPAQALPIAVPDGGDLEADVRELVLLSDAL
ncbi:DUF6545 domain-containing protein [Streptomyces sp. NPDC052012]|uniref:DUF6545 domain-containing protein n=1 Tax=Streptomyces sp. NPDC052012 TaxID=3155051 RepID=UPI00344F6F84